MAARKALFKDAVDEEDDEYCTRARCMDDGVDQRDPLTMAGVIQLRHVQVVESGTPRGALR